MACFQNYTFAANANTVVDTNVQVEITWFGDLGGSIAQFITILGGQSCNTISFFSGGNFNCIGEYFSGISVILDPSSYGIQTYEVGATDTSGLYPC
jgi:hypothetical protein